MTIKEYKVANGLTYEELFKRVKPIEPKITIPLLSYMCQGYIEETPGITAWLARQSKSEYTEMEANVLYWLEQYPSVTRYMLKSFTHLPDRQNRRIIESLRAKGNWIVTGEDGKGYRYTEDRDELNAFLAVYTSKSKTIFRNAAAMAHTDPNQVGL